MTAWEVIALWLDNGFHFLLAFLGLISAAFLVLKMYLRGQQ